MSKVDEAIQSARRLAGDLWGSSLVYVTGSSAYGLKVEDSDTDLTLIYHDPVDHRRLFKTYPEVEHSAGNDHKLYSLRKFAALFAIGNPNIVEMIHFDVSAITRTGKRFNANQDLILSFIDTVSTYAATTHVAAAYRGHIQRLWKEIERGRETSPKRLSHVYRLAACCVEMMRIGWVPQFSTMYAHREIARKIKTGEIDDVAAKLLIVEMEKEMEEAYAHVGDFLPDNLLLRKIINEFFERYVT
jgi:predicted nucleotidyltransferase